VCVYDQKTLDNQLIPSTYHMYMFFNSIFNLYICPLVVYTHIHIVQYKNFLKSIFNTFMSFNSINIYVCR